MSIKIRVNQKSLTHFLKVYLKRKNREGKNSLASSKEKKIILEIFNDFFHRDEVPQNKILTSMREND